MTPVLLALLALSPELPSASLPHGGPPLSMRFLIAPGVIELRVRGEQRVLNSWLGLGEIFEEELPAGAQQALLGIAGDVFAEQGDLVVDGVELEPQSCRAAWWLAYGFAGAGLPGLELVFLYEYEGPLAETLSFRWNEYRGIDGRGDYFERIPLNFLLDNVYSSGDIYRFEPAYVWHAAEERDRIEFVPPDAPTPLVPWRIPGGAFALLAVGLGGVIYLRWLRAPGAVQVALVLVAAGSAFAFRERAIFEWVPPSARRAELPDDGAALELFERLHQNVYAAFAAEAESDIYDILARSVEPELLDELYAEIYSSLILRGEGGARCEIQQLEVEEAAVSSRDAEAATFTVDYAWRVYGSVFHFEHGHQRINQYRARYYVRNGGDGWRIAAVDTREYLRIGDDAELEVVYLEEPGDESADESEADE